MRARVEALFREVDLARDAARPQSSPLWAVLPFDPLNDLAAELEQAVNAAAMLFPADDGSPPLPDLLGAVDRAPGER